MIVRDERATLRRCLESVASIVDEMIVVDTGSTDGTQEIATACGARLIQSRWQDDFSLARNESIAAATGAWILVLDADEYLPPEDAQALRQLIQTHTDAEGRGTTAFQLLLQNLSADGRPGMLAHITRLFPHLPGVRFEWPIHEQVMTSLERTGIPVRSTSIRFFHTGYTVREKNITKQRRNRDILAAQISASRQVTPMTHFLLGGAHLDLGDHSHALAAYQTAHEAALRPGAGHAMPAVAEGATVRMVTCLLALRRISEAIALMPPEFTPDWHPELVALRAEAEAAAQRPDEARQWYERVLGCTNTPRIPAYDLPQLQCDALQFLASYWKARQRPALALGLLRAALAVKQQGTSFSPADLQKLFDNTPG